MDSTSNRRIGQNIRRARRAAGLTQEQLAGLAGRSEGWLSQVENGITLLDRRSDIAAVASGLGVPAEVLFGEPVPEMVSGRRAWNLTALRGVLLDSGLGDPPDAPARPLPVLAELAGRADLALRWGRYDELLPLLPSLLTELEVHAAGRDGGARAAALRLLVQVTGTTVIALRYAEQTDLAFVAAELGRAAAAASGDAVLGGAALFCAAHARLSATRPRPLMMSVRAAGELEPLAGAGRMAREVYGMTLLSAGLACAVDGDHPGAAGFGAEAAAVAGPLGDQPDAWELFGPSNVAVWRAGFAVEAGDGAAALDLAGAVNARALASANRRAALQLEAARALVQLGKPGEAVTRLRKAERLSAPQVHGSPMVREMVRHILDTSGGPELRGLARRVGAAVLPGR